MEEYNLRGKVAEIFDTKEISEKFKKREFVVEVNTSNERGSFIDFIKLQTVNNNCDLLEGVHKKDLVAVRWRLAGRKWKKDNEISYFTNIEAVDITVVSKADGTGDEDSIEDQLPIGDETPFSKPQDEIPDSDDEVTDLPF